jgi:phage terminase large subunit GpA-like protein
MTRLSSTERIGLEVAAAALRPTPPLDLLAWAQRHVVFEDGPLRGPYNPTLFPYFSEILRALGPSGPRHVTLMSSAQIGKTVLGSIFCLASITETQGAFMVVHPSDDNAARWSKMKLGPMMRAIEVVREKFPQRARDTASSVLFKERKDGLSRLLITGAASPSSLSMVTIDRQVQDDI